MSRISRRGFIKSAVAITTLPMLLQADTSNRQEKLRFIHITDSHMDLSDSDSVEAMELMVSFINKNYMDLDFVLFGGDNFNNNVPNKKDALVFKQIIDKLHCPSYLVRGNKESSAKSKGIDLNDFKNIFFEDKSLVLNGKDWLLQTKGYSILGLDSCVENVNNGIYTEDTIKFAENALRTKRPTIILNHHPYTNYWGGTEEKDIHKYVLNNTDEVQKRLFSYSNLILTLSGHKHIDSITQINNTKVIVTRGFVRPLDLDMYPMKYIEVDNTQVNEKLIYTS
jgi:Icc protein